MTQRSLRIAEHALASMKLGITSGRAQRAA
ncbi:MAG: hypothetical protein QOG11_1181 [Solirubrobacteraceae bacterium]|nr:hypothetical protein [Solirubrobacteraceae bacterium]